MTIPNLMKEKKPSIDIIKWSGWFLAFSLLVAIFVYFISIRRPLVFTVMNPKAVSICEEGYLGEHGEADKRFEMKQKGTLINPLVEEAKKEQSQ